MALVVKVGGTVAADEQCMASIIREIADSGEPALLVHGGGKAVTELAGRLGIVSTFRDGVRLTQSEEMAVVDMVLAGKTNTDLVRLAHRTGVAAIGLTGADGGLLIGRILYPHDGGRTAAVSSVNLEPVKAIQQAGFLPVLATVGVGEDGYGVNINADEAAQAIAREWARHGEEVVRLCYLSDTAGVLDPEGGLISEIPSARVENLIATGVVQGGMAAKLRSCVAAIETGVARIVIAGYRESGDLARLVQGELGTTITRSGTPQATGDAR